VTACLGPSAVPRHHRHQRSHLPRFEGTLGGIRVALTEHANGGPPGTTCGAGKIRIGKLRLTGSSSYRAAPRSSYAGVTTSDVDEHPCVAGRAARVRLVPKDGAERRPRQSTWTGEPRPTRSRCQARTTGPAGSGRGNVPPIPRYAALPSATVAVGGAATSSAGCARGDLERDGRAEAGQVSLELVEGGRNWVHVSVVDDATGRPVPCRVHFRSPAGIPYQRTATTITSRRNLGSWHYDVGGDVRLGQTQLRVHRRHLPGVAATGRGRRGRRARVSSTNRLGRPCGSSRVSGT